MSIGQFLKVWVISYIGFFILDMFTHVVLLSSLFTAELGSIMRSSSEAIFPIMLLQTVIISMSSVFLIWKTQSTTHTLPQTMSLGAVMGLLIYGIHELANYSSLVTWSLNVTIAHTVAGIIQMAIVAVWIAFVMEKWGPKRA